MVVFLAAVLLSFIPALFYSWGIYWLDRYEKEPRMLLGTVFVWGAFVATTVALIVSIALEAGVMAITGSALLTDFSGTTFIAPFAEETLKGIAVLLVFWFIHNEFDSILDGIVYASITALGFAATENVLYLFFEGYVEDGMMGMMMLFLLRVVFGGWNHAVYTSFFGIGLAIARLSHNGFIKVVAPLCGWIIGMTLHGVHNGMSIVLGNSMGLSSLVVTMLVDWLSWLLVFGIIVWAVFREKRWITTYLQEEVAQGVITPHQYRIVRSSWALLAVRIRALLRGNHQQVSHFYQLCAELAQKKHQFARFGDVKHTEALIRTMRAELRTRSPHMPV